MPATINYTNCLIIFDHWFTDAPKIDNLVDEMNANAFRWRNNNWKEYLRYNYSLNISIKYYSGRILIFQNINVMEQFISKFIKDDTLFNNKTIDKDKLIIWWHYWHDAQMFKKIVEEMNGNDFKWYKNNMNEYLSKHYGISGDVIHATGIMLLFDSMPDMQLFIMTFL